MEDKDIKIVYMGTPEFAVPTLCKLNEKYNVKAVVTVPDKPKGRGLKLLPSEVKSAALELGIPVLQPQSLKDQEFINNLKDIDPDFIVVIAFRILPESVYSLAKTAAFNIHGSLLPRFRGPAPINHAIINGDSETGLTSFILKKMVDTGDVVLQTRTPIGKNETFGDLYSRLELLAPDLAVHTIEILRSGDFKAIIQDESSATPAPKIFASDCKINWHDSAENVKNRINGVSPSPGAWTMMNGERVKFLRAEAAITGEITAIEDLGKFSIENGNFSAKCADGKINIKELQMPGKKAQPVSHFLNGWHGPTVGIFE